MWHTGKKVPEIFFIKNSRLHFIKWLNVFTNEVKFAYDLYAIAYRTPTKSKLKFVNKFDGQKIEISNIVLMSYDINLKLSVL